MTRNQILGFRSTNEFVDRFEELSDRLGHNKSEVIRYALTKFLNEHNNNEEIFNNTKKELY